MICRQLETSIKIGEIMSNEVMIFPVPSMELEDRLDVVFYLPIYRKILKQISKHSTTATLGEIATISRILGFETERYIKYVEEGIPYLRVQNIREFEIDLNEVKFISEEAHHLLRRSRLKPNDIILTITGRVGTAAVIPDDLGECNASQEIVRIRIKIENYVKPYYLAAFLNSKFGKSLIMRWQSGSTRPRTLINNIRNIPIPILPVSKQVAIEKIVKEAWEKKKEVERNIEELRNIADEILTSYLQIKLPSLEDKFIFIATSTYINDRFDVEFYSPKYIELIKKINNSPNKVRTLKEISKNIVSGQRPKGGVKYIRDGVPSIGGEHITSEGDFNFENIRFVPKEFHQQKKKSWVKPFDILIVKDGATTGKVAIVSEDYLFKNCNINEHVFKVEIKDNYNPYYIFSYLFSSLGQEQINRFISGAAQKGITRDAIESVRVIIPPLEIQNKIAEEIIKRKEENKRLKKEAEEVIEKAKKEVEKMIIGEL